LLLDRTGAAAVESQMSLAGRDEAFVGERPNDAAEPWRAFYVSRNYFALARRHGTPTWVLAHLAYSLRRLQLASSRAERRAILDGLVAGARGRSGKDARYLRRQGELPIGATGGAPERQPVARPRRVLHILPNDVARGAQMSVRELREALDSPVDEHRSLTLFAAEPAVLFPDYSLEIPSGRWRRAGWDPRVHRRLRTALVVLRPDIVVAHGGEPLLYVAPALRAGAPLVYFAFGTVSEKARRGPRRRLYTALIDRATVVAGISLEVLEEAEQVFGVPLARLALLPNGRDPDRYLPRRAAARASEVVTLIFVGHLTVTKRPDRFVAVVEELARKGHAVRGRVVGDGPLEAQLRSATPEADVEVLGRRTDVPALLGDADVLVFTGVPPEGMPGVLIEAGLSGLPVVTTDVPGASTVVEHRRTGFVVPMNDLGAMVDAVERLVVDRVMRSEMGAAARDRCVEQFSLEAEAKRWRDLLASLVPVPADGSGEETPDA
jgi:glycosyltransferase involved in cell wall biosynthesis